MKYKKNWELIKSTPKCQKFIESFEKTISEDVSPVDIVNGLFTVMAELGEECPPEFAAAWTFQLWANIPNVIKEIDENSYCLYVDNLEVWQTYIKEDGSICKGTKKKDCILPRGKYRILNSMMHVISSFLYTINPFFKPIFFSDHFDWIQRNCENLGIPIPDVPRTNDYRKYTMYYLDLCKAFSVFQDENGLSNSEFMAYLYFYGDQLVDIETTVELPRPTNVWLTGANPYDWDKLEKNEINRSAWACNEMTQRGDIVIVYAVSPHSCFHSIWRADSGGCFNPFNYYHCRTTVVDCQPIPHITYKEFMNDPILSDFTIAHKNLQGINGFELSAKEYLSFIDYLRNHGCNTSVLPKLVNLSTWTHPEIIMGNKDEEKQVENKYIKPLLHNILGYTENDYTQQARHKSGRKESSIPDFVFFQKGEHHLENCPFLIEAKYDFRSTRQRRKDYEQGLCYAQTYHSKIMSIMDRHRVIVYCVNDDGTADYSHPIFEQQWEVIYSDPIQQAKLISLIGRETVKNMK